jgi:Domain of unknown function DUF29
MNDHGTDIVAWSEHQAELLRRQTSDGLDWSHLATEVEAIGTGILHQVEELIERAIVHRLEVLCWPEAHEATRWHLALSSLNQAKMLWRPVWQNRIDLSRIYDRARHKLPADVFGVRPVVPAPEECPWTWAELMVADGPRMVIPLPRSRAQTSEA